MLPALQSPTIWLPDPLQGIRQPEIPRDLGVGDVVNVDLVSRPNHRQKVMIPPIMSKNIPKMPKEKRWGLLQGYRELI